jgi:hypothetical protein
MQLSVNTNGVLEVNNEKKVENNEAIKVNFTFIPSLERN